MEKKYSGSVSAEETERERRHRRIARQAAADGIVLLKNDGVLPLAPGTKLALYGGGARHTIKGGTGSGWVNNRSSVSIDEGLRNAGIRIATDAWLDHYDREYNACRERWIAHIYELAGEPGSFDRLYRAHASHLMEMPEGEPVSPETKADAQTALFVISRTSGEGADRKAEKGDYALSDAEYRMLRNITAVYERTILVLNTGGIMDLSFLDELKISALVLLSQAGMEGGNALADVLTGRAAAPGLL